MSKLYIIKDEDGYWLKIETEQNQALISLDAHGPIVKETVETAYIEQLLE